MKKLPLLFEDHVPGSVAGSARSGLARGVFLILLIFLGTRVVTWTSAYYGAFALLRIEQGLDPPFEKHYKAWRELASQGKQPEAYDEARELLGNFAPLCRFDGVHYRSIIGGGYQYEKPAPGETRRAKLEQNIAFFPLYPALCSPLAEGLGAHAAMILVAHVCALAAGILLYLWVRRRVDEATAIFTIATLFCWPASVYYSFGYAESTTLLAFVIALWLMDRRAFLPAAVACGLATASRPTALPIAAVFALAYWLNEPSTRGRRLARLVPLGIVTGAGIIAYAVYLTARFGSPLVYLDNFRAGWVTEAQRSTWFEYLTFARVWDQFKYVGRLFEAFPAGLVNAANPLMWNMPLNLFILFLSLAGLSRVPRSFRPLLALGPLIFLHAYLASGGATFGVEPVARYTAVSVPAFIVLAAWCTREWRAGYRCALVTGFVLLQAAWAYRFGLQEWSG